MATTANGGLKLNYKRTALIGFAFFGILLLWQVWDTWCPALLTDIYAARETDPGDLNSGMLAEGMRRKGIQARWTPSFADVREALTAGWKPGDLVITLGCGDINQLNEELK